MSPAGWCSSTALPAHHRRHRADDLVHGQPLGPAQVERERRRVVAHGRVRERVGDVVHVDRVDVRLPVADHGHRGQVADERHELVHAAVARAVDPRRPQDRVLEPALPDGGLRAVLGDEPRLRPALPRARARHVDEPPDADALRAADRDLGALAVHLQVRPPFRRILDGMVRELDGVHHHVGARERLGERGRVARERLLQADASVERVLLRVTRGGRDLVAGRQQPPYDLTSDEARAAGDDDAHRRPTRAAARGSSRARAPRSASAAPRSSRCAPPPT